MYPFSHPFGNFLKLLGRGIGLDGIGYEADNRDVARHIAKAWVQSVQ